MAGLKYYERTKLLIELIEKRKTGSPGELANRLGVKERMVYRIMDDLRLMVEEEIIYCKEFKSYIFQKKFADCNEMSVTRIYVWVF
ncbi:HTH domain-containing protein [Algoriphagus alkaliphilus]|uniref:HTH domain-containing protein n=1 Tax=Algoriphagus alkaliphilus TaxID=279824 RepID=A0A1G5XJM9_9BACT|nr:HTH domain-containing protein [Algoriphagus alkaliphilus]SDA70659.1 HTH domain-containing protein [Algoriphagus alkaliphilus]